jgi:drug/metabolite transporter (DMT)-like permease
MKNTSPEGSPLSLAVLAAFAGLYIIWGTTYFAIALTLKTLPPFIAGGARFLIAGGLMYAWLRWQRLRPLEGVNIGAAILCGVLLSGIGNGFVIWAQQTIPSGIAALIVTAVPVIVLILDWAFFSKRAPSKQALVGVALGVAGVVTIVAHTHSLSGNAQPIYIIALVIAAVGWSFGTLLQKRTAGPSVVLSFTCVQMLAGGLFQLVMAAATREWTRFDLHHISTTSVMALLYLVLFGSIFGLNCFLWLLTRVSAQKVTTYALVNPVVALFLGAMFLNERITSTVILAAALVLAGVALVLFQGVSVTRWLQTRRTFGSADSV